MQGAMFDKYRRIQVLVPTAHLLRSSFAVFAILASYMIAVWGRITSLGTIV